MKCYIQKEVGKRIQKVRKQAGVKQADLAEELYISREMISRIENGKSSCSPDLLGYLCERFDKTADYFYFGEFYENELQTRLEIINELKKMIQEAEMEVLLRIYKVAKILIEEK